LRRWGQKQLRFTDIQEKGRMEAAERERQSRVAGPAAMKN